MLDARLMSGLRVLAILALAAMLTLFVAAVRRHAREPLAEQGEAPLAAAPAAAPAALAIPRVPFPFTSNVECSACHMDIYAEWMQDEHARAWFNEPLLPQDPKRTECNNCHAPAPILETGIEQLAVIRTGRFEEGVGCIECHRNVDHVEGPLASTEAPCNPTRNPVFTQSNVCNPCHAAHGSFDEWQASEWGRKGITCQECHMPVVERRTVTGGPVRKARTHRMRTQRDATMLAEAMTFDARVRGRSVVVTLANTGTGHNLPGEIFNREIFVTTTVTDAQGNQLARHRESLKTVKREQRSTEKSTQLESGGSRTWTYDLPPGNGRVDAAVRYKYLFLAPDSAAEIVHEKSAAF
jgi:hypothetical protein